MKGARQALIESMFAADHYQQPLAELEAAQREAAQASFAEQVETVPLLRRRAEEAGMSGVRELADLVPLLFPHTAYKSYPRSFIDRGQWPRLLQWMRGLAVSGFDDVPLAAVNGIDGFLDQLLATGHEVLATSGTSGKCSFLVRNAADRALQRRYVTRVLEDFVGLTPAADRPVFMLFPPDGPNNGVQIARMNAELWGRPGEIHFLGDEPLRVSEMMASATLRQRMSRGEARPDEISAADTEAAARGQRMRQRLEALAERMVELREEPMMVAGQWAQHWGIVQHFERKGIAGGSFHADSVVSAGGGIKGVSLPDDYEARIGAFYGDVRRPKNYGMTEMLLMMPRCEAGAYHVPAALIPFVLDEAGEHALPREGVVSGRFGFVDLGLTGRWGGIISGDRVSMDFAPTCACGRRGPVVLEPITRMAQPGDDDHIGCAGTIDAYLRDAV